MTENSSFHVSDDDLLLAADGELSKRHSIQIRAHIAACWACRARMAEIEGTISELVHVTREAAAQEIPPIDRARARLTAKLAVLARTSPPHQFGPLRAALNRRSLAYASAVALLFLGTWFLHQRIISHERSTPGTSYAAALPNPTLTPGASQPVSLQSICSSEHDEVVRAVPESVRQEVFREYGIAPGDPAAYEVDYLVTPGLGGTNDLRNLWPEPRYGITWNSRVKDQLEDHLHHLVCTGQVNLATAQYDIESDWISSYKQYFHTETPLLPYSADTAGLTPNGELTADVSAGWTER